MPADEAGKGWMSLRDVQMCNVAARQWLKLATRLCNKSKPAHCDYWYYLVAELQCEHLLHQNRPYMDHRSTYCVRTASRRLYFWQPASP